MISVLWIIAGLLFIVLFSTRVGRFLAGLALAILWLVLCVVSFLVWSSGSRASASIACRRPYSVGAVPGGAATRHTNL